ncbi:cytidine deaminase-like protein [Lipomyces oligophaga]|uniref:cytidine deaminase-like protein n=1 Tax=Lipomyces oligophaga TaxID=45792 RepID=UPI0034CF49D7
MVESDEFYLELALKEAQNCVATPTAFCVGAVIVLPADIVLSTGYSRELPGNTHAEQCALEKLINQGHIPPARSAVIYTTMEPCSERLSGNLPCVDRILQSNLFHTVVVGVVEPDTFIKKNIGKQKLSDAGINYFHVSGFEQRCLEIAQRGH